MGNAEDRIPVIVGIGFRQEKSDDPAACPEAWRLMADAVADACADTGAAGVAGRIESVSVVQGMWRYVNPGKLVADAVGCPGAKSILADLGVLQLSVLFDLLRAIAAGETSLGVVVGGEAKYRDLRASITGVTLDQVVEPEDTPPPDIHHPIPDPFATEAESRAGISMPVELFGVIESAMRAHDGLSIDEHRDRVARLYASFSEVAAGNPHAWVRTPASAGEIREPGPRNAMLAFPYTKRHASQWNVNQASAILACSAARARALGIDESRWIHPVAAVQSRHVLCLAEQPSLHTRLGTRIVGERARALAGIGPSDLDAAELYSCFPAAIQSFARDLSIGDAVPWTVTGSMAFAGGPFNSASLDGAARMIEVLREGSGRRRTGLVSNLSGIFGKQAVLVLSNRPGPEGFRFADVTDEVAAREAAVPTTADYTGPATIAGYVVSYDRSGPARAFAYCDTPDGRRTVARSTDPALLERMTREEFVGRAVRVDEDRAFAPA